VVTAAQPPGRPIPIIIDTDIGEDIDDLLVLCFALNSPEFEVLAVTTVDGDTAARSRIARRVTSAYGRPEVPVVAGYPRSMPDADEPYPPLTAVTQNAVAATEEGLPPPCELGADDLIARLAAERPGQIYLLTIGWNLRYDPVAAATVARSQARWVLLPEGMRGLGGLTAEDVEKIRTRGLATTDIIYLAIQEWRKNKRECGPESIPHLSDLRCFAYLLGGVIETRPGRAYVTIGPRKTLAELRVELDDDGPHLLGWQADGEAGRRLHDLLMQRLLSEPLGRNA
jgi:inosine-uridine nucleoside N-ribohydrolase